MAVTSFFGTWKFAQPTVLAQIIDTNELHAGAWGVELSKVYNSIHLFSPQTSPNNI
jgi:hypothetical protein